MGLSVCECAKRRKETSPTGQSQKAAKNEGAQWENGVILLLPKRERLGCVTSGRELRFCGCVFCLRTCTGGRKRESALPMRRLGRNPAGKREMGTGSASVVQDAREREGAQASSSSKEAVSQAEPSRAPCQVTRTGGAGGGDSREETK